MSKLNQVLIVAVSGLSSEIHDYSSDAVVEAIAEYLCNDESVLKEAGVLVPFVAKPSEDLLIPAVYEYVVNSAEANDVRLAILAEKDKPNLSSHHTIIKEVNDRETIPGELLPVLVTGMYAKDMEDVEGYGTVSLLESGGWKVVVPVDRSHGMVPSGQMICDRMESVCRNAAEVKEVESSVVVRKTEEDVHDVYLKVTLENGRTLLWTAIFGNETSDIVEGYSEDVFIVKQNFSIGL